jgi:hypothetical protein
MDSVKLMMGVKRMTGGRCRPALAATVAALACSLGACGSVMNSMPDVSGFRLPDRSTFVPTRASINYTITPSGEVGAADLVDGQGQCTAAAAAPADGASRGIRLDMTECEVVRALGQPQSVDVSSQSGWGTDRRIVMTWKIGERPGIYEFTRGRLSAIQRGDEAAAPPPAAAKKPARKPQPPPA